jgi:hypothetical protein
MWTGFVWVRIGTAGGLSSGAQVQKVTCSYLVSSRRVQWTIFMVHKFIHVHSLLQFGFVTSISLAWQAAQHSIQDWLHWTYVP